MRKSVEKKKKKLECLLKNFERTHGDKERNVADKINTLISEI